mmetsp:Transcript_48553/g.115406  ORF Transcript_48553/g.115406 Transcript_48553/m.115406 type:complete len:302 (+) Transcript_48553:90-995(+)
MASQSSSVWNKASSGYGVFSRFTSQFAEPMANVVVEKLGDSRRESITLLDACTGPGDATFQLLSTLLAHPTMAGTQIHATATDFSSAMIEKLQTSLASEEGRSAQAKAVANAIQTGALKLQAEVADAQDHSAYPDESFDVITCLFGIMFPKEPERAVREFWRLLKPGGVVVVGTWHCNTLGEDIFSDLAHKFMQQERYVDIMPAFTKYRHEGFVRRLLRGEEGGSALWVDDDMDARLASAKARMTPAQVAGLLNVLPVVSHYGTWDEKAAEEYLEQKWVSKAGAVEIHGSALILTARKPSQ